MKLRHIFEAVISTILPLFQNVFVAFGWTWPMTMPLVVYLWGHFLYGWYEGIYFDPIRFFLGTSITVAGLLLFLGALWFFGKRRGTLVRSGVYGVSRHPQYLGLIVLTLGTSITLLPREWEHSGMENWIFVAVSYVFLAVYEDENLAKEYDNYEKYRDSVPFLFPLICSPKICRRFTSRFAEAFLTMAVILPIAVATAMISSPQILTPGPIILLAAVILLIALSIDVTLKKTTSDEAKTVILFVYAIIFLASVVNFLLSSHGFVGEETIAFTLLSLTAIEKMRIQEMNEAKGSVIVHSLFLVATLLYTRWLSTGLHSPYETSNPFFFVVATLAMMVLVDKFKKETRSLSIYRKNSRTFKIISSILISIPLLASLIGISYLKYLNFLSTGHLPPTSDDVFRLLQLFPLTIATVTMKTF